MVVVSIVIGLGAVFLASRWVTQQAPLATTQILVAAADLELGTRLTPLAFKLVDWPKSNTLAGTLHDPKALTDRVLNTSMARGEPITESKLAPVGSVGGLSSVIASGKRAMTVRVNDVVGVAGFALPGNYVDIVVNTDDDSVKEEGKSHSVSKIVLQHILVLAVAQVASRDDTKPKLVNAVTLEVTPEQAERLDLARSVGTLSLMLRNQVDVMPLNTVGATKPDMLGRPDTVGLAPIIQVSAPMGPTQACEELPVVVQAPAPPPPPAVHTRHTAKNRRQPAPIVVAPPVAPAPEPVKKSQIEVIKGAQRSNEDL